MIHQALDTGFGRCWSETLLCVCSRLSFHLSRGRSASTSQKITMSGPIASGYRGGPPKNKQIANLLDAMGPSVKMKTSPRARAQQRLASQRPEAQMRDQLDGSYSVIPVTPAAAHHILQSTDFSEAPTPPEEHRSHQCWWQGTGRVAARRRLRFRIVGCVTRRAVYDISRKHIAAGQTGRDMLAGNIINRYSGNAAADDPKSQVCCAAPLSPVPCHQHW